MPDKTQLRLIRGVFLRLMISSVLVTMTTCACGLIDNMFISRFLGEEALAAAGFFSPVTAIIGLSSVIVLGTHIDKPCIGCDSGHPVFTEDLVQNNSLDNFRQMCMDAR